MSEILFLMFVCVLGIVTGTLPYTPCTISWEFAGPTGYVDESDTLSSFGATNTIVGGNNGVWFAGTVNGGVWRTKDLYANNYNPKWEAVTDNQPVTCAAIGAVTVADWNPNLVAAGCGGTTSGMMQTDWNVLNTGDWGGLMLSKDAGDTWSMTEFPPNYYITAIVFLRVKNDFGIILVSARSNAFDPNSGGIWQSQDLGKTWTKTFDRPVYHLIHDPNTNHVFASLALALDTVFSSQDFGKSWNAMADGLDWDNRMPGFTQLAISITDSTKPILFLGAFTDTDTPGNVQSALFWIELNSGGKWKKIEGMPYSLDPDSMPKDRMALLADPKLPNILYVAGNADGAGPCDGGDCTTVFRVDWQKGEWTHAVGMNDTSDNSMPHPDCRGLAWDYSVDNLLLVHDGGLQVRVLPRTTNGQWHGLAGDIGVMEFYAAHWDNRLERWIAGAQDNDVQVTYPAKTGTLRAMGFLGCDGMRTGIDNMHNPARMLSSCQFLDGLTVFSGDPLQAIPMKVSDYFTEATAFPYFLPPWTINSQQPGQMFFWVNGTASRPAGVWQVTVPSNPEKNGVPLGDLGIWDIDRRFDSDLEAEGDNGDRDDDDVDRNDKMDDDDKAKRDAFVNLMDPKPVVNSAHLYEIVAGGYTSGKSDPGLLIAMNEKTLFQKSGQGKLTSTALPSKFAVPSIFPVVDDQPVLAPISHGKTVSLAVSPAESQIIVVTGWPDDMINGTEHIWLTQDGAKTWVDIIGNLFAAVVTVFKIRPSGVLIIEFSDQSFDAILVGTVSGVFLSWTDSEIQGKWSRVGLLSDFPLVKVAGLSYEHYSDVLVAATYGRGVYILKNVKQLLLKERNQQMKMTCDVPLPSKPASSAKFFPAQES